MSISGSLSPTLVTVSTVSKYIALDGVDGSGKTTGGKAVVERLTTRHRPDDQRNRAEQSNEFQPLSERSHRQHRSASSRKADTAMVRAWNDSMVSAVS